MYYFKSSVSFLTAHVSWQYLDLGIFLTFNLKSIDVIIHFYQMSVNHFFTL